MSQLLSDTEGFPWSNFTASGRHSVVLPSSSSVFLAGSKCKLLIRNFMQLSPEKPISVPRHRENSTCY